MAAELSPAHAPRPAQGLKTWHWVLLALTGLALVWGGVIWRWRSAGADPQASDLVLQLLLLPLAVLALLAAAVAVVRARTTAASAAPTARADDIAAGAAAASLAPWARVLGVALRSPAADDPTALLQAAHSGLPLPTPDADLTHADGLPVMTARIAGLGSVETTSLPTPLRPAVRRALAALAKPLRETLGQAQDWLARAEPAAAPAAPRNDFQLQRPTGSAPAHRPRPQLQLRVVWPGDWSAGEQAQAEAWLQAQVQRAGLGPQCTMGTTTDTPAPAGTALAEPSFAALLRRTRGEMSAPGTAPALWLLLACHSDLDDDALHALSLQHRLFHAQDCPGGRVACEAAFALLLAPADLPLDTASATAPLDAAPVATAWLLQADEAGAANTPGPAAGGLEAECQRLLQARACAATDLIGVVSDADRHGGAALHLVQACSAIALPLPSPETLVLTGPVAGQGPTGGGLVLAAALERSQSAGGPCLALVHADTSWPLALLVQPA